MSDIIYKFIEKGINISPEAYERIINLKNPLTFTNNLLLKLKSTHTKKELSSPLTEETVLKYLNNEENTNNNTLNENNAPIEENSNVNVSSAVIGDNSKVNVSKIVENKSEVVESQNETIKPQIESIESQNEGNKKANTAHNPQSTVKNSQNKKFVPTDVSKSFRNLYKSDTQYNFEVIQDTTNKSYTSGELSNLISYFGSRFNKLSNILSKRPELRVHQKISDIVGNVNDLNLIGMVKEIRTTKNNHRILELEDDTGEISVLFHKDNQELFNESEMLVKDEVIGITGEKKGSLAIASQIIHPGVQRIPKKEMDFSIAFTSDVHVGSLKFLEQAFLNFIDWINGDYGNEDLRKIGKDIKYLVIAGDIVDGIGIYPSQDKELKIKDITEQYDKAAEYLGKLRSDVKIILGPGNHDASRIAEPQPAVPEDYANSLYQLDNVEFVSNPAVVNIEGFNTLIYHGKSFDDLAMSIKGVSYQKNDLIMEEMLKMRHLAPIYGEKTPLASELEDHLVIDEVPDIFHTGHIHINKYKNYNGVHMINSGSFQTQTEFQKIHNLVPTPGIVSILHRGEYMELDFSKTN